MDIRPLDLTDDAAMRAAYDVQKRAALLGREEMPFETFEEFLGSLRSPDSGERQEVFVAVDHDAIVGVYVAWYFLLDNRDKVWFWLHVDPLARRQGVASALLQHLESRARLDGRTDAITETPLPVGESTSHGYRAFARSRGYDLSNTEVIRHLRLPVIDSLIEEWIDESAAPASDYRFETLVDAVPDEYIESLCVLLGQLAVDAPSGEVDYEEEVITPERLREARATASAMGRTVFETIAIAADGTVAAQSTLLVPTENRAAPIFQWGTFVHREHRGHRLGMAVKARNLRAAQAANTRSPLITTQNAETNDYMVSINDRLGFVPVENSVELLKRL